MTDPAHEPHHPSPAILIATLGTEPQVVTAALDLLLRAGEAVRTVLVCHTTAPGTGIERACQTLQTAFGQPPYAGRVALRLEALRDAAGQPLADVDTPAAGAAALRGLYAALRRARQSGLRLHLCIAGGRKTLAIYGMVAAQLLFEPGDRLWHLHSGGDFLASKRLHPSPDDEVHLVPIPVILWSRLTPAALSLGDQPDPFAAAEQIQRLQLNERVAQARSFVLGSLTPAEARVVERLVRGGVSDHELAEALHLSPRTVEQHLRAAYTKAADHWELADVNRAQLVALLNLYFLSIPENTGKPA